MIDGQFKECQETIIGGKMCNPLEYSNFIHEVVSVPQAGNNNTCVQEAAFVFDSLLLMLVSHIQTLDTRIKKDT